MKVTLELIATKKLTPRHAQRCLIHSVELDKLIFAYHFHDGHFEYEHSGGISRVFAEWWISEDDINIEICNSVAVVV